MAERTELGYLAGLRVSLFNSSDLERDSAKIVDEFLIFVCMKRDHLANALCINLHAIPTELPPLFQKHE